MVEAEKGIISKLITSSDWNEIYDFLIPEAFTSKFCRNCYEILLEENQAKEEHDVVSLVEKLKLKDKSLLEVEINENIKEIIGCDVLGLFAKKSAESLMANLTANRLVKLLDTNKINGANVFQEAERISKELQEIRSPAKVGMNMTDFVKAFDGKYFTVREDNSVRTGFPTLDQYLTIDGGDMVVVGARPAVGKTAFAIQMAEQMADLGKKVLVFNLEMVENQIFERMLSTEMGFSLSKIKRLQGLQKGEETDKYHKALETIMSRDLTFITGSQKVSDIRMSTRQIKPDVVIVDYLQLVKSDASYNNNRYAEVGQISHDLKSLAIEMEIPIVVLTQLNRIAKATDEPSMNEIRESGDIEQDASVILLLWNTDENDFSNKGIKIDKNRQGQLHKWVNTFVFDGDSMRFVDREQFHNPSDDDIAVLVAEDDILGIVEKDEVVSENNKVDDVEIKEEQIEKTDTSEEKETESSKEDAGESKEEIYNDFFSITDEDIPWESDE